MSELDWDSLKYFLAVARTGGLTSAAEALGSSAATVSRRIDSLEKHLGTRLFLRHQQGYLLTDIGSSLLDQALEVESSVHAIERKGVAGNDGLEGEVTLATYESIAHYLIVPHLPKLQEQYPKLQLELLVNRHIANLSRREADIALRIIDPSMVNHSPDYIAQKIGSFRFELYCSPSLLEKYTEWQRLPHISWDSMWVNLPMAEWMKQLYPGCLPALRSNSMQAHYVAARNGLGAAMLPRFIGDIDPQLTRIDIGELSTDQELWLSYHRDMRSSQRVQIVKAFLKEVCQLELAKY